MKTSICWLIGLLLLIGSQVAAEEHAIDPAGYLYGIVETESGSTYTGTLRWGREESFWGDHFNASKKDLPRREGRAEPDRKKRRIKILGVTISIGDEWEWNDSRQFVARFGDIRMIERASRGRVYVTMKDGTEYEVGDSSNDVGATITVDDASLGRLKIDWDRLERVTFSGAPADLVPEAERLFGVVKTTAGDFRGFIQWDLHECLSTDELDGETEDGDVAIEMGRIAAIEKRNRDGAWVELLDGRRLLLEDTNDVDDSISGIFVEDERYGRVKIDWDEFERVDFERSPSTGPAYSDFSELGALSGRVTDEDGKILSGEITIDLDESRGWEILNGDLDEIEYNIPLVMVASIEPTSRDRSRVVLRSGEELVLEDATDVSDDNDGVLVASGETESYLEWDEVAKVEFD